MAFVPVRSPLSAARRSIPAIALAAVFALLAAPAADAQSTPRQESAPQSPAEGNASQDKSDAQDKNKKKDKDASEKKNKNKKDEQAEGIHFELKDHPTLVFGKKTHIDFRARFRADATESDLSAREDEVTQPDD